MTTFLTPEEINPEAIENIFRTAMFPIQEHEPFESNTETGRFVCFDNNFGIKIIVDPVVKTIAYRAAIRRGENIKDRILFQAETGNWLMQDFPMLRIIVRDSLVHFDYCLHGNNGVSPPMLIAAFRAFSKTLGEVLARIYALANSFEVLEFLDGKPLPPGKDFDTSDIDKLMENLMADDTTPN